MLPLAADENLNGAIVRGVLLRNASIDLVRIQDVGLRGADDATVLAWAAEEGRVVLTHDVATMTQAAFERVDAGLTMPGVFEIGLGVPVGVAIEDLLLIAECSLPGEWVGQVRYLPLR